MGKERGIKNHEDLVRDYLELLLVCLNLPTWSRAAAPIGKKVRLAGPEAWLGGPVQRATYVLTPTGSRRVVVVCVCLSVCHHFSKFRGGISSQRFELKSWNLVWSTLEFPQVTKLYPLPMARRTKIERPFRRGLNFQTFMMYHAFFWRALNLALDFKFNITYIFINDGNVVNNHISLKPTPLCGCFLFVIP